MPIIALPTPALKIGPAEARRFLLSHHGLWPPRSLRGKAGVLAYLQRVGCIQFDPIDVVRRNPDLVLQSRLAGYRPALLDGMLYGSRQLLDGWDKMASIYPVEDWPFFARQRHLMRAHHGAPDNPAMAIAPQLLETIRRYGPHSSIDFEHDERIDYAWGRETRLVRAALEELYAMGDLGIQRRMGSRRVYDLVERLLPAALIEASDPHPSLEAYHDWHVLRRICGLGLADSRSGDYWLGIVGAKSPQRRDALARLVERGLAVAIAVEGLEGQVFFLRAADQAALEGLRHQPLPPAEAAFLAPLDNLLWDRRLIRSIFGFEYTWEVYKPAAQRSYGYYTLPVLYGDRFIARFEPAYDRQTRTLTIQGWWWEAKAPRDEASQEALAHCLTAFRRYLGAEQVSLGPAVAADRRLAWAVSQAS